MSLPVTGLDDLASRLGSVLPPEQLAPALAHRSWCSENPGHASNERLEFLGDAVLGMVITDQVYRAHDALSEGLLTELRKSMVNSVTLAEVAAEVGIGEHLLLGRGEEQSGGRAKPSILADALEAIIGAAYLHGGFGAAQELVMLLLGDRLAAAPLDGSDHKSRLQELTAQLFGSAPRYVVDASGPDHARSFDVQVVVDGEVLGRGEGRSKKQAEQIAARTAIDHLLAGATDVPTTRSDPTEAPDG